MRIPFGVMVLAGALAVSGCAQKGLRVLQKPGTGPDEFLVLPTKPLSTPDNFSSLPAPTPGGANLTDVNPQAEAVAALGGKPGDLVAVSGVPSGDAALVTASSRYGVEPGVRDTLAKEDAKFRHRNRHLGRIKIVPVDRYEQLYRKQSIDPFAVSDQFRRAGAATPSSPPEEES
ncbi:DUF3035 domain-containing protein [Leisingera caerulea]|uniref:DUF3035 domain-containing protein n=1 Tax=Leisingera caerulea TaxID=506591 RepID=A0A9Q9HGN2_LEICA|nr:DUF3035 domain-containing protein [Leisingera caerulea]UWQ49849.1 DUF3035 domain-containing protein [Leisingera caerulea]UWQ53981.1 DUF3035 domain-containing protein [Leisingera caerulea]UWQ58573.1 DUF3035 domain-containing protein [Leisingera caerulea]